MGIFLLWATWAHEYMDILVNIDRYRTWGRFKTRTEVRYFENDDGSCGEMF